MKKIIAVLAGAALAATACGTDSDTPSGQQPAGGTQTLTVFAAASLTESFGALEKQFEAAHAGVDVKLNLAGSSKLVQQINEGAPADVFASADQTNMDKAVKAGQVNGEAKVFATNKLAIVTAPGNPKGIKTFADLNKSGQTVVVCAAQVPCGAAAKKVETSTKVTLKPVSEEQDVKAVLSKVQAGEADAGLVYVTDAKAAGSKVTEVDFAEADGAINNYPIAVLKNAPQPDLARQFTELVLGDAGKQELSKAGFGAP